jgi:hypothetical protein
MQGLDDEETAQTMIDGLRIYYNFMRPHMVLDRERERIERRNSHKKHKSLAVQHPRISSR